jgi:hypothetical protein
MFGIFTSLEIPPKMKPGGRYAETDRARKSVKLALVP